MRHIIVGNKQTMCIGAPVKSVIVFNRIGVYGAGVGKGNIVKSRVRQFFVYITDNVFGRQVKVICAAGSKVKLLLGLVSDAQGNIYRLACVIDFIIAV